MRLHAVVAASILAFAPAAPAGEVGGRIRFAGPAAPPEPVRVTKDQGTCGESQPDESLLVGAEGALANAVVSIRAIPGFRAEPARLVLDQRGCRFVPRVQAAPVGSTLDIVNGDPVLHNVHGWAGKATAFNVPQPMQGQRTARTLGRPGLVRVGCDVHGWMAAFVYVADGPAAVTGKDGAFRLRDVPAGTYTVTAWHERLGERTAQVTVPADGEARVDLAFDAAATAGLARER